MSALRLFAGHALETARFRGTPFSLASRAWEAIADPVRPVSLPRHARVVGVGGATLGGSGKTPTVLALARALADKARVAVVGHGYRARTARARVVRCDDDVRDVGDEALMLSRALAAIHVPVVVARSRSEAIARAAELGELVLVDGLLQARPERLACSLLVVDPESPWGSRHCPPVGDLRAAPRALLRACDHVVGFRGEIIGARAPDGRLVDARELADKRLGLVLALARPERVLRQLRSLGVEPMCVEHAPDHGRPPPTRRPRGPEAWLTTAKCATKLGETRGGAPIWVLEQRPLLPPGLVERVLGRG